MRISSPMRDAVAATLVELTVAIGIFSFAVLAIWGSLQVGAQVSHRAKELQYVAQIQQQLFSRAQENTANLPTESAPVYFDGEGLVTDETTWVYQAYFQAIPAKTIDLPGDTSNPWLTQAEVVVKMRNGQTSVGHQLFVAPNS